MIKKINRNLYKIHLVQISVLLNLRKIDECYDYIESIFSSDLEEEEYIFFESILEIINLIKESTNSYYNNIDIIEAKIQKIQQNINKLEKYQREMEKELIQELLNILFSLGNYKYKKFSINWHSFI